LKKGATANMKRLILGLLFTVFLSYPAWAALSVDNTTIFDQDASGGTWTIPHTTGATANGLVVLCSASNSSLAGFDSVTYAGVAMTQEVLQTAAAGAAAVFIA
jgi:hypothetical protein